MRAAPFLPRFLPLVALAATAACADLPTGSGGSPVTEPTGEDLALSLDEMAASASLEGDTDAASAFADGALAIRLGAVPTEIAVTVAGQGYRYFAVAIGIVERAPGGGAELLRRSVVAWTGDPRPTAAFRVMARSDQAQFGRDDDRNDPGRAVGTWVDFERDHRFVAIDGSLATELSSIAGNCPNVSSDPRFACNLARFAMRMDGTFELVGDATVRLPIASEATNIGGVVVRRTDGGTGGRPGVTPSRPQPTRGTTPTRG